MQSRYLAIRRSGIRLARNMIRPLASLQPLRPSSLVRYFRPLCFTIVSAGLFAIHANGQKLAREEGHTLIEREVVKEAMAKRKLDQVALIKGCSAFHDFHFTARSA